MVQPSEHSAKTPILLANDKIKNLKNTKTETDHNPKTSSVPTLKGPNYEDPNDDKSELRPNSRNNSRKGRRNRKGTNPTGVILASPSEALLHNYSSAGRGITG